MRAFYSQLVHKIRGFYVVQDLNTLRLRGRAQFNGFFDQANLQGNNGLHSQLQRTERE